MVKLPSVEPDPSSDEDLVLNEPVRNSRRKRKNTGSAASHEPKRPKLVDIEKIIASSSRTNNAAAGGSGGRIPSARRSKSPSSRYGTNPRTAQLSTGNKPSESVATARTKVVKRTRKEKQRQRSSSSSGSLPDASMLASLSQKSNSFPSASAPVPKRGEGYQREALRDRFSSTKSAPVKDRKTDKTGDVIEILDSDEEPSEPKLGKPKRTKLKSTLNKDSAIIEVVSDSDDLEFRRRSEISAARKFQPRKSIPQDSQDIIILDSDDDPPLPTADSQNDNAGQVPITMKPELTHDDSRSNCISGPAPSESHESPRVSHEKDNRIVHDSSIPSPLPDPVEDEASVGMGFDGGDIVLRDASPPHAKDDDSITPPPFVSTPWSASGPVLKDSVVPDVGISKVPPLTSNAATGSSFISTQPLPQRRSPGSLSPSPSTVIVHPRPQEQGGLSDPIVSISEPSLLNVAPSTSPVSSVATHPIAHVSEAPSNSPEGQNRALFLRHCMVKSPRLCPFCSVLTACCRLIRMTGMTLMSHRNHLRYKLPFRVLFLRLNSLRRHHPQHINRCTSSRSHPLIVDSLCRFLAQARLSILLYPRIRLRNLPRPIKSFAMVP
ncbi:hypothetical protein B0H10DRAFT_1308280 [Mycena sp. CBHHK59/15]|nr:hypothetical protein B0H10DRAFT_1308280 [Mycena sp. CBHHK59/15]